MKKIIPFVFAALFLIVPSISNAQSTSGTCTGEIRTDMVAAQDCINKAIAQGEALGYEMSCKVEQLGLAGFIDPTSGKDYILNGVCTVDGSTGHGAYLLAGFTAAPGSNAIIQSVNPGWNTLKTELLYEGAFAQCGGKAPYASVVNGVSVYSCTAPTAGAVPISSSSIGSTRNAESSAVDISTRASSALLSTLTSLYANLLNTYKNTFGIDLRSLMVGGTSSTGTTVSTPTNSQCYVFTQTLQNGSTGNEVFALTYALKHEGFLSQTTNVFDTTVMVAVKRFQEAHSTEILNILGLTQGTGIVATKTREYLNSRCIVPASVITTAPQPSTSSCVAPRSAIKNGKYQYTFTKSVGGNWTVTLNNPAYSTPSDPYYVPANISFSATNALDLNRQNQGRFNYLQALPGTAVGNTEYANLFGSFNNAYYDWDVMTKDVVCTTGVSLPVTPTSPTPFTPLSNNQVRYIKISVADWDTLPLALREVTVVGANNTIVRPVSISATDFDKVGYQPASNLIDSNENTIWRATKSASTCAVSTDPSAGRGADTISGRTCEVFGDLQVITLDLGQVIALDRVNVMNYGLTDTRVVVIEVSADNNTYTQIAEVRAQANAPIADKGMIIGVVKAAGTVGPIQY